MAASVNRQTSSCTEDFQIIQRLIVFTASTVFPIYTRRQERKQAGFLSRYAGKRNG